MNDSREQLLKRITPVKHRATSAFTVCSNVKSIGIFEN